MGMKKYKLSEIATVLAGGTPSTKIDKYWNGSIPWLSVKDFCSVNKWVSSTEKTITQEGFDNCPSSMLKKGDLILSARGTVGKIAMADKNMAFNQSCFGLRAKKDFVTSDFLFYWFLNNQQIFKGAQQGNVFKSITLDFFEKTNAIIPPLPTQQKIAAVLSSLDDKIALNKKINAKLEAMAKRLYDYWFVQFDFPNEEGKPYKSSGGKMEYNATLKRDIPEGWEVKSINEVCDVIDCLHSKKPDFCYEDEDSYLLSLENITKEGYIDISEKYYISKKDFSEWTSRICVEENDFLFTNAGRAGDMGMIPNGIKCAIGRNITAVRSKKINPYYLRCFFKSLYMKEQILNNLDKGCFFMSFNVRSIKQLSILIPKEENFHKFISFCEPIIKQLNKNNSEIQKLTNLRDRLLPLLMNGQVEVEG